MFTGYDSDQRQRHRRGAAARRRAVEMLAAGERGVVVLDRTPFYAESGGQVGDTRLPERRRRLRRGDATPARPRAIICHHVRVLEGTLRWAIAAGTIDNELRQKTRLNHSATHLLHAALRQVLGEHVRSAARWWMRSACASTSRTRRP
jgi:alanyl-tRNA synthetase